MNLELKGKGISSKHTEGNKCTCDGGVDGYYHQLLIRNVDNSFLHDAERRKLSPTSESMRAKVLAYRNGHK